MPNVVKSYLNACIAHPPKSLAAHFDYHDYYLPYFDKYLKESHILYKLNLPQKFFKYFRELVLYFIVI